jgi:Kef-type K+ transport system membrane component KefB/nucleotide-binding universal stress UspA family protein
MPDTLSPLPSHAILLLLLQLAGLLMLARALAEGMRRIGQPAVIGELLAGILLGPSVLGFVAPDLFAWAFPRDPEQFHLLEIIAWLGMVLLLLLTGLETDVRAMKNLGRAAFMASVFGMVVPFASGLALGWLLPDRFLTDAANRPLFAAFLATAMAISAMPVIAKILMDLDLLRRNVGMVILSAGVVDDTTGWVILSVIAGLAAGGSLSLSSIGLTLLWTGLFIAGMRWIAYPAMGRALRYVNERVDLAGGDLTLILGFTFLAAATTEAIGIHAVFGAFAAGILVRQLPRVRPQSIETLEVFVLSALSPLFFAFVGLRVDLWQMSGVWLPLLVISVAVAGKLAGCYVGGRLGRLSHWESLAVGFGMNARGAMELIVALIGLSLGLLTAEMYASIVLVAVVTSFMAPILLRVALPHLTLGADERHRLEEEAIGLSITAGPMRVLVPTAGGENAMAAMEFAAPLVRRGAGELTALYVESGRPGVLRGAVARLRGRPLPGTRLTEHLSRARELVNADGEHFRTREVRAADVAAAVLHEATRDYDLVLMGTAPDRPFEDTLALRVVRECPVPVALVRRATDRSEGPPQAWRDVGTSDRGPVGPPDVAKLHRLLVPVDGSLVSRQAAELAFAYTGAAGGVVRVLHVVDDLRLASGSMPVPDLRDRRELPRERVEELESRIRNELGPLAELHGARLEVRVMASAAPAEVIIAESLSGSYDLVVLGAENKQLARPLFFGQGTADIVERSGCTTIVLIPGSR